VAERRSGGGIRDFHDFLHSNYLTRLSQQRLPRIDLQNQFLALTPKRNANGPAVRTDVAQYVDGLSAARNGVSVDGSDDIAGR